MTQRPPASPDYASELVSARRHNFTIILGVHALWGLGTAFISPVALMPVFLQELGASNRVIGVLPAVMTLCMFGPQIFAAHLTESLPVKKRVFTCIHYPAAAAIAFLGVVTWVWGAARPGALVGFTLVCISFHSLALSFAIPMWSNLVAKLMSRDSLGRTLGVIFFAGGITGALGGFAAKIMSERLPFPQGFALGYVMAAVLMGGGVSFFFILREPHQPEVAPRKNIWAFYRALWRDLHGVRDYGFYLLSQVSSGLGRMAPPFFAVAARNEHGFGVEVGALFTAIFMFSRVVASPLAGMLGDRFGFRFLSLFPPALNVAAAALALASSHPVFFYAVFVLVGLSNAAESVSTINLPIDFCPHADKTAFLAARATVVSPVQAVAPLLGGVLADSLGGRFTWTFGLAILFELVAVVILVTWVRDPRRGKDRT
jgi:MFS family permease